MLSTALGMCESAAHSPDDVDWTALPDDCLVAMHWHRTQELAGFLASRGFKPIVTVRHPLDVLISILHFSQCDPATAQWLAGEGGDETLLRGADPTSLEFLEYALSDRASALLAISAEWARHAVSIVRYEDLVAQPKTVVELVIRQLSLSPRKPLAEVIAAHTIELLRPISPHHIWRGEPGLWRRLVIREFWENIWQRHRETFELFGYSCHSPTNVTPAAARESWRALCEPEKHNSSTGLHPLSEPNESAGA